MIGGFRAATKLRPLLTGPLNRLNATLSLRYPLDRNRTPSAIGSAIVWPYLTVSCIHTGRITRPRHPKPLRRLNRVIVVLYYASIVSETPWKQARNKSVIEAVIVDRLLDRDWTLNRMTTEGLWPISRETMSSGCATKEVHSEFWTWTYQGRFWKRQNTSGNGVSCLFCSFLAVYLEEQKTIKDNWEKKKTLGLGVQILLFCGSQSPPPKFFPKSAETLFASCFPGFVALQTTSWNLGGKVLVQETHLIANTLFYSVGV